MLKIGQKVQVTNRWSIDFGLVGEVVDIEQWEGQFIYKIQGSNLAFSEASLQRVKAKVSWSFTIFLIGTYALVGWSGFSWVTSVQHGLISTVFIIAWFLGCYFISRQK